MVSDLQFAPEQLATGKRRREARCGTEPGVKRHRRLGEKPCRACQDAKNAANRRRAAAIAAPRPPRVTVTRLYEVECRALGCGVIGAWASRTDAETARQKHRDEHRQGGDR